MQNRVAILAFKITSDSGLRWLRTIYAIAYRRFASSCQPGCNARGFRGSSRFRTDSRGSQSDRNYAATGRDSTGANRYGTAKSSRAFQFLETKIIDRGYAEQRAQEATAFVKVSSNKTLKNIDQS